jgi:hypothetical protein
MGDPSHVVGQSYDAGTSSRDGVSNFLSRALISNNTLTRLKMLTSTALPAPKPWPPECLRKPYPVLLRQWRPVL